MFTLNWSNLRIATQDDISHIVSMLERPMIDQAFVYPLSCRRITIEERVRSKWPNGFWLIYLHEGRIIGCRGCKGVIDECDKVVEFSTTAVDPDFQGNGIGVLLLRVAVGVAIRKYSPCIMKYPSWVTNYAMEKASLKAGFSKGLPFDDPYKRPPGIKSVEYFIKCDGIHVGEYPLPTSIEKQIMVV